MRRIIYPDAKRKKLTQDALEQVRRTRELIDPELLSHAREIIARHSREGAAMASQATAIPVDRRKNMSTILKFLELTAENKGLHKQIQDMFSGGTQH